VAALDELSDECGGGADYYDKLEASSSTDIRRELIIEVPDEAIRDLFKIPLVAATTVKATSHKEKA